MDKEKKIQELHITKVYYTDKKKDGTQIKDGKGNVKFRVGLKAQEFGDQWINGFLYKEPKDWDGKTIKVSLWEEEFGGKKQLNFELPRKDDEVKSQMVNVMMAMTTNFITVNKKLDAIGSLLETLTGKTAVVNKAPVSNLEDFDIGLADTPEGQGMTAEDDVNIDDIPF